MEDRFDPRTVRVRKALMDAAHELVSRHPLDEVSVTDVAQTAGVSRRVLYQHFGDLATLVAETTVSIEKQLLKDVVTDQPVEDAREYMAKVLNTFVAGVYADRAFARNAMHGASAYKVCLMTTEMLDSMMKEHVMGSKIGAESLTTNDRRYAISAGLVALLVQWLDSDYQNENSPENIAQRLLDTMFRLAGVA